MLYNENKTVLNLSKIDLTDDELFDVAMSNTDYKIERDADKNLILIEPSGFESDNTSFEIAREVGNWNEETNQGKVVGSNAGFILPSKAMRSPDAAWISNKIIDEIPAEMRKKFLPACPEFIVEVKSPSDTVAELKEKMVEWIENGCELAWLVNPDDESVWVYRKNEEPFLQSFKQILTGYDVLKGFELNLSKLFKK